MHGNTIEFITKHQLIKVNSSKLLIITPYVFLQFMYPKKLRKSNKKVKNFKEALFI